MNGDKLIRETCKKYNLTQKQLAEILGYSESAIRNAAAVHGKISKPLEKAIALYEETQAQKAKLEECEAFKTFMKKFIGT